MPARLYYTNKMIMLLYHHISEQESDISISPRRFSEHLDALRASGYQVISIDDWIAFTRAQQMLPPNAVVISFDDGYESFYRYAYPELKRRGLTATEFLIVSYVGEFSSGLAYLNWPQVMEMKSTGFSFYSHTYNLHQMSERPEHQQASLLVSRLYIKEEGRVETEQEYKLRVQNDLATAEWLLHAHLGNTYSVLSFPYGEYNAQVVELARRLGIEYFATTQQGINGANDYLMHRIHAGMPHIDGETLLEMLRVYDG